MTPLRSQHRWLVLLVAALACLVLAVVAIGGLRQVGQVLTATSASPCSPSPCSAPHGLEVDIADITTANGVVMMQVRFKNATTPDALDAVSYRHTSPADFQLRSRDGQQERPRFETRCPDWGELRIERGASAAPKPLCFAAPAAGLSGAQMIWSPDLGLLFDDVQIPLGQR
jgi:hypothetical protein